MTWSPGGLNFQIEHHLFPRARTRCICICICIWARPRVEVEVGDDACGEAADGADEVAAAGWLHVIHEGGEEDWAVAVDEDAAGVSPWQTTRTARQPSRAWVSLCRSPAVRVADEPEVGKRVVGLLNQAR